MAQPILVNFPSEDPREALARRLANAPQEHAEALLSVYEIIQQLHDKGLLEIAKGGLASGEKVLQIVVESTDKPEVIRGIRNAMILAKIASSLDPALLESLAKALPDGLKEAQQPKPPGLFATLKNLMSEDSRRVLAMSAGLLQSLGKSLGEKKAE